MTGLDAVYDVSCVQYIRYPLSEGTVCIISVLSLQWWRTTIAASGHVGFGCNIVVGSRIVAYTHIQDHLSQMEVSHTREYKYIGLSMISYQPAASLSSSLIRRLLLG